MTRTLKLRRRAQVRGTCTWCGGPVQKPKLFWCSDECVHQWKLRSSPQYLRGQTFRRDHGVCGACGVRTEEIRVELQRGVDEIRRCLAKPEFFRDWGKGETAEEFLAREREAHAAWRATAYPEARRIFEQYREIWIQHGLRIDPLEDRNWAFRLVTLTVPHLWEADHIVPVEAGGGGCGLDNIQTLCRVCHQNKNRELARERARRRKIHAVP